MSLEIPLRKGNLGQKSISFMEPSIWNKLSNEMKILTTSTLVTHNLKKLQKNIIKSSRQDEDFVKTSKKTPEKQKSSFPHSALFHRETRVSLKYFVNDCLWKHCFASNSRQIM